MRLQKQKGKMTPINIFQEYLKNTDHPALSHAQEDRGRVAKHSKNSDK